MFFPGDLGFRVAVFFIFGVFPVIFFVLGRKWRIAVARQQEIKRLPVLATEEAARAEIEAIFHTIKVFFRLMAFHPNQHRNKVHGERYTMASRCRILFPWRRINLLFVREYELDEDRLLIHIVLLRGCVERELLKQIH